MSKFQFYSLANIEYTYSASQSQNISQNQTSSNNTEFQWQDDETTTGSNFQLMATLFNTSQSVNSHTGIEQRDYQTASAPSHELNIPYTVFEVLVAICAVLGNLMVIIVFQRERKLRRRTNYYIVSLAMADLLVGCLGIPFAILASVGLPTNLYACLFTVSLLVVLCTISIFCLVAVSVDRYWAILYPMAYSRNVRTRTTIVIIGLCWLAGSIVGSLPLLGWHAAHNNPYPTCLFVEVMDYNYLVFLYFATIITPAVLMLAFYAHIYQVIIKQVRQIVTMNPARISTYSKQRNELNRPSPLNHGGTMLRVLGAARKREIKATQNLSIIVLFFMICWLPLYTINCIQAFCNSCDIHPKLTLLCIILTHLNSAVNPILYAYHLKDFRLALKNFVLRLMGFKVSQPLDIMNRYSMASQHRLPPRALSTRHISNRIYIDSPIWLREQQDKVSEMPVLFGNYKVGLVTPCLNTINKTAVAVAAVNVNAEQPINNISDSNINNTYSTESLFSKPYFKPNLTTTQSEFDVILLSKNNRGSNLAIDTNSLKRQYNGFSALNVNNSRHSYSDYDLYCMKSIENQVVPLTPQFEHDKRNSNRSIFVITNSLKSFTPDRPMRRSTKPLGSSLDISAPTIGSC